MRDVTVPINRQDHLMSIFSIRRQLMPHRIQQVTDDALYCIFSIDL